MLAAMEPDGRPYREHLQGQVGRARNAARRQALEEELALPPFPEAVRYLWLAYWRIRARCGHGPEPVSWGAIADFVALSGLRLAPWEINIIEALDDAWVAASRRRNQEDQAWPSQ